MTSAPPATPAPPTPEPATYAPSHCVLCGKDPSSIYQYETVDGTYPVEGTSIFFFIVLLSAAFEFLIDYLSDIESEYFQAIVSSIKQEMLVCSLIGMLIIGAKSFGALSERWNLMLNYSILTFFFMIIFMIIIVLSIVLSLRVEMAKWKFFEGTDIDVPHAKLTAKQELFKQCRERFRESLLAKDVKQVEKILFSDYLLAVQTRSMKAITDLGWKCWSGLAAVILLNGMRARGTAPQGTTATLTDQDWLNNITSYIFTVGCITMIIFLVLHFVIQSRVRTFAQSQAARKAPDGSWIVVDASDFLFFGSLESTAGIFQTVILVLEWYFAVYVLAMAADSFKVFGWGGLGFIVIAIIPLIVFATVFPWTVVMITMLSFLGTGIDEKEATSLVEHADEQTKHNSQLTQAHEDEQNRKKTDFRAGMGINDEWGGDHVQTVTLHSSSSTDKHAANLDTTVPTWDSKDFQHPNAVELAKIRKVKLALIQQEQAAAQAEADAKSRGSGAAAASSAIGGGGGGGSSSSKHKLGVLSLPLKRDPAAEARRSPAADPNVFMRSAVPSAAAAASSSSSSIEAPLIHKSRPVDPMDEL